MYKLTIVFIISICYTLAYPQDTLYTPIDIPVRTGDSLAADLYTTNSATPKPVIFIQTPYNKATYRAVSYLVDWDDSTGFWNFVHYNFVIMDWRGFYASAHAASAGYDRGLDGYDAIEWIASQTWCNGDVGTYGGSALGDIQFKTAKHQPPHLVCAAPWIKDLKLDYFNYYYGGDYMKEHTESHEVLGFLTTDLILAHPRQDIWWTLAEMLSDYPESIAVPLLMLSGWYDHFPTQVLEDFHEFVARSDPTVRAKHKLIMGPWTHSEVGKLEQGELEFPDAVGYDAVYAKLFFDHYLRGVANGYESVPVIQYFQMGTNEWRTASDWYAIDRDIDTLYLHPGGELLWSGPSTGTHYDSFAYDPRNPSPAYGGPRFNPTIPDLRVGPWDQRDSVEARSDVLIFSTPVLDESLEITGPVYALLYVSSNRLDTDFSVRLCDVYPDGRSIIQNMAIRRMRFRSSYSSEELMTPGEVYSILIEIQDIALTFLAGHRIRLIVSSSCYPHYDINLNNGGDMYTPGDTMIAMNKVHFDATHPSALILPVVGEGTEIAEKNIQMPDKYEISCYPNPFNESISIKIDFRSFSNNFYNSGLEKLHAQAGIGLDVYDINGRLAFSDRQGCLSIQGRDACLYRWEPKKSLTSGIYFVKIKSGSNI
ncbi:CocE/NonD family hydrolase, partial [bacterium]|nr:CocE/NonD family hydrolase [bacterium]